MTDALGSTWVEEPAAPQSGTPQSTTENLAGGASDAELTRRSRRAAIVASAASARAKRDRAVRRRLLVAGALAVVAIVLAVLIVPRLIGSDAGGGVAADPTAPATTEGAGPAQDPASSAVADPSAAATSGAASPAAVPPTSASDPRGSDSLQVLVNKRTPLNPLEYAPAEIVSMASLGIPSANDHSLRREAAEGIERLFAAASQEGISLDMTSGYRDADLQRTLYERYVSELGQEGADATSARPGFSEHQTGLAADISAPSEGCILEGCFAGTTAGRWLAAHAWEHGFILRYPEGQTATTGYEFEPWHYRFVGIDTAREYHASGKATYEDFLGAGAAPDYAP